ncbi:MAG: chromosome segregation ATPase [Urechidicola sp.]
MQTPKPYLLIHLQTYQSMYTTIAVSIIIGLIGFFIGKNLKTKSDQNWKVKYNESSRELKSMSKQHNKEKKKSQQLERHQTNAQEKIQETEEKYIPLNESLSQQLQATQTEMLTLQNNLDKLTSDHTYLTHQHGVIKKEKSRLNDKYATDLKASKGWGNQKVSLDREIGNLKERILTSMKENKELQNKIDGQVEKMHEVSKFTKEFRIMKSTNRKLTKDLTYWEQKQFETNHELATTTKEIVALKTEQEELVLRFKGAQIQKENMMMKIEEFKTKFVNVNNLYHELKEKVSLN